jgi:hypothetical protein
MQINCDGCCILYDNGRPPYREVCDIKRSFSDVFPIIIEKDFNDPRLIELISSFSIYENSTLEKRAASFSVGEVITGRKEHLTRVENFRVRYKLKFFLKFSNAQKMVLRCRRTETLTSGKLQFATISTIKGWNTKNYYTNYSSAAARILNYTEHVLLLKENYTSSNLVKCIFEYVIENLKMPYIFH